MATEFKLPEVGEGIESGTVVSVLVAVGDRVEVDQPVLELETDKAVVEVPSSVSGVVESLNVQENQPASVGQVVLTVAEGEGAGEEAAPEEAPGEQAAPEATPSPPEVPAAEERGRAPDAGEAAPSDRDEGRPEPREPAQAGAPARRQAERGDGGTEGPGRDGGLIPAAPSVRRLARELGVDLQAVQGSGILGRISAEDVRAFAEGRPVREAPGAPGAPTGPAPVELPDFSQWGETERVAMSGIRRATVRSMSTAWSTVPMVTHFDEADATEFEALRKRHQPDAERLGAKLTPTAMLIKVVAAALRKFPDFNASLDVAREEIVYKRYVNVGVAVDTEHGLLVPVIKGADRKNMLELAAELGELAERARDRKLSPADMQGGNFSVSNLGGIGGTGFTPIVNPPDVAILGVSRGRHQPVYDRDTGEFEPRMMMPFALTYDHRLIDGAKAARFLRWVCRAVEDPFLMSLEG